MQIDPRTEFPPILVPRFYENCFIYDENLLFPIPTGAAIVLNHKTENKLLFLDSEMKT